MPKGVYCKKPEHRKKISNTLKIKGIKPRVFSGEDNHLYGKKRHWKNLEQTREKMSISAKGKIVSIETREKMSKNRKGDKHWNWKKDRTQLVKSEKKHLDGRYREWMFKVKNRDNWKCRINNSDCKGRLESHHILNWKTYPGLRYEINNGITLCRAHHPLGRKDEAKLSLYFQKLVAEMY